MEESAAHFAPPSIDQSITTEEALDELERVLADPQFQSTERNRKFLRFVAEELFQGHESSVKAYSIAVDVFGRPSSFDPAIDPIVRIEATRLRASLTRYYELHGRDGGVRIDLPRGRYIPTFTRLDLPVDTAPERTAAGAESRLDDPPARREHSSSRLWPVRPARWTAVALAVLCAVGLATFLAPGALNRAGGPRVISEKPSVEIRIKLAGNDLDDEALRLRDALMVALSQFQTLQVASAELPRVKRADPLETSSIFTTKQNSYQVILKYSADRDARSVWWQVIDPFDGEALSSGTERVVLSSPFKPVDETLVGHLATRLAAGRGVINSIETAREMANPTIGSGCVLQAYLAFERPHSEMLETARACLEETLALRPNDPDANAALAAVLLKIDPPDAPTELSQRALKLADKAVDLAPYSDRSAAARMAALFRAGQIEAAVRAGRRGMELNPNNAAIPAKLGSILFTVGKWEEGIPLVIKAGQIETAPLRDAEITLAMDAYRRGEYDEALLRLEQMGRTDCFCASVLRAATLGQLGRKQEAEVAAESLRISRGRFEKSFRKDMEARRFAPVIIASLEAGLAKAGISVK